MSQEDGVAFCERLFAKYLDGNALISNAKHLRGSANWIRFPRVICNTWVHWQDIAGKQTPIVLMGDAAHTAHFSIGSGTKLALEDAIDLADEFTDNAGADMATVLQGYEARRSVEVLKIQNAARNSTEWFEHVDRYTGMEIQQFAYSLLTRSQRISHENLRLRDAKWLEGYEDWLQQRSGGRSVGGKPTPPMLLPLKVRNVELKNRIVVSPMAQYKARDGVVGDWHLVHLGARAVGGAALVMVEMTSPTPEGRITPGCPGLWNDAQQAALARIVDFAHQQSSAKMGMQLGHSGPKGSTQLGWDAIDEPLPSGNWPLLSASAVPYGAQNQVPKAMNRADMDAMTAAFVVSTKRAADAGFDWLELHCAHGYLLSASSAPLTNQRSDEYGGSLDNRCRYPLEVFAAMRAVWPADKPMSVRISAHDWAPGGNTPDDAVAIARLFKAAGCDVIDVSSGQTTRAGQAGVWPHVPDAVCRPRAQRGRHPDHGRGRHQRSRPRQQHHRGAGRADLCAVARPHLADPAWTLHEAAKLQSRAVQTGHSLMKAGATSSTAKSHVSRRCKARWSHKTPPKHHEHERRAGPLQASSHGPRGRRHPMLTDTLDLEARASEHAQELRLWLRLLTCSQLIEKRVRAGLREQFDTTLPRFDLMAQLERHPEGLKMKELSHRLMVTGGNVTGITDQLVAEGLVERVAVEGDRRAFLRAAHARGPQWVRTHGGTARAVDRRGLRRSGRRATWTTLHKLLGKVKQHQLDINQRMGSETE